MARLRAAGLMMFALIAAEPVLADDALGYRSYERAGKFETVREDLKDAIIKRGFVIDHVGHFNKMLERTVDAAVPANPAGVKSPYRNAEYMQFCPSKLTHEAVRANPVAIANCPIAIFIYELTTAEGAIHLGYRLPVASPSRLSKEINAKLAATLDEIAKEATKP